MQNRSDYWTQHFGKANDFVLEISEQTKQNFAGLK